MKKLLLLISVLFGISSFAQYNPENVNKKAVAAYNRGIQELQNGLPVKDALPLLEKAVQLDPNYMDAYLSLAGGYAEIRDYSKSVANYKKAKDIDSSYFKIFYLPYATSLAASGQFNEALDAVNHFLEIPNLNDRNKANAEYKKKTYEFAIDYASKHPADNYVFAPINLGDSINTPRHEYYPSFTIDDSIFVFTQNGGGIRENFMESRLMDSGYHKAKLIEGDINVEPSKGALNISQDGEWLLFAGNFARGFGNFDLYISYNTPTGWSEPTNLGPAINTDFWDSSPSLSPDKNTLYFASDRPGGYGGKDLYVSYRQPNGKWSQAENMGPNINTKGDELAPFIHADNQTLYFTSSGLPGYGSFDIFVTRKGADGKWGVPENIGYPVNTVDNEGSLFIASDGVTGYFAADRADSRGGLDLYKFKLRADIRPAKTLYVQGYVTDATTQKGIPCSVDLFDDKTQQPVTHLQTDETGFYFVTLPVNKDYTFVVNRKGYLFYSDVFALATKPSDSTYKKNISLQPIAVNSSVTLKNIQFETNSYKLQPVSIIELNKLVQLLKDNETVKVQINGHTDNTGTPAQNMQLSLNRAKAVVEYLVSNGIDAKRLAAKGFGETKPIADNNTEEGKAANRRTEFVITSI
ncbi:OmpA family protein [Danxiaibacter flavus]|uniref:OmpA family protein n=1 Tax=Danxiaibacter flavus TaxID=3049108 RepID=A0ABV3ZF38_9BACT|nr:OmpA family protein [Chitinophagaceae bacterium DXS]